MSTPKPKYDCYHDMPEVEPNGDISGPGVVAGFLGTAYLALLVLAGYYLFAFDPKRDPYQQSQIEPEPTPKPPVDEDEDSEQIELDTLSSNQGDANQQQQQQQQQSEPPPEDSPPNAEADWAPNPIDIWFLNTVRKLLRIRRYRRGEDKAEADIEKAFNDCMRSLCDNQLMTGVGVLLSAYCILDRADGQGLITAYHWQIAVYLAWLSNLTHTTGLTFLRKYLAHHRTERFWRTVSMTGMVLLVFVSFQPLVYFNWDAADLNDEGKEREAQPASPSSYAVCFFRLGVARQRMRDSGFDGLMPYSSGSSAIVSMLLLIFSFTTRMIKLSKTSSRWVRLFRKWCSNRTKRFIDGRSPKSADAGDEGQPVLTARGNFVASFGMAVLLTARLYFDLLTSMLSEVYWAFVAGAWVSVRIFKSRASAQVDEDMFSFGQILAVFLLVSPVLTTLVALWPLRTAFWELRESRAPPPGVGLQHVDTLPAAEPSAAEVYRQFSDSTTSYDRPGTTLIISGACFLVLWATGLYFWFIASVNADGFTILTNAAFLAFGQPFCSVCAYMGTLGAAEVTYSPEPAQSNEVEATDLSESAAADQTTEPAAAQSQQSQQSQEAQQAQQASEEPSVTTTTRKKHQLLRMLIVTQFFVFPALATVGMSLGSTFMYAFMGWQPPLSLYCFFAMSLYVSVLGRREGQTVWRILKGGPPVLSSALS